MLNQTDSQEIIKKSNNLTFNEKSRIKTDTLLIGYPINKFMPSILITNVQANQNLYYNNKFVGKDDKSSIVYGLNANYSYAKGISFYISFIAPDKELNLTYAINFGINYNF